ncbi:hypothetical protein J3458_022574 [Metarhizium acridum]|uniref:uncharacterized protein n=1 Tax=Metarhizium acridum TaxID=92637 RepID=UPI001C6AE59C|nr:hypothetical protein J3458_022574 [Metarhizium acridum]
MLREQGTVKRRIRDKGALPHGTAPQASARRQWSFRNEFLCRGTIPWGTTGVLSARLLAVSSMPSPRMRELSPRESALKTFDILPLWLCRSIRAREVVSRSTGFLRHVEKGLLNLNVRVSEPSPFR